MTLPAAPSLLTARLRLTVPGLRDHAPSCAMWSAPEVCRFIGGRPSTREEVWGRLLRYAGLWSLLGFGYWAVRERISDAYVGEVGFGDFRRDMEPGLGSDPEIGWALAPQMWGRGYASEAIQAAISWMDARHGHETVACIVAPENARSVALAQQFGFQLQGGAVYKGSSVDVYRRMARAHGGDRGSSSLVA